MYKEDDFTIPNQSKESKIVDVNEETDKIQDTNFDLTIIIQEFLKGNNEANEFLRKYLFIPDNYSSQPISIDDVFANLRILLSENFKNITNEERLMHALDLVLTLSSDQFCYVLPQFIDENWLQFFINLFSYANKAISTTSMEIIINMMQNDRNLLSILENFDIWDNIFNIVSFSQHENDESYYEKCFDLLASFSNVFWKQHHNDMQEFLPKYHNYALKLLQYPNPHTISKAFKCFRYIHWNTKDYKPNNVVIDMIISCSINFPTALNSIFKFLDSYRSSDDESIFNEIESRGFNEHIIDLLNPDDDVVSSQILFYLGTRSIFPSFGGIYWDKLVSLLVDGGYPLKSASMHFFNEMFSEIDEEATAPFINDHFLELLSDLIQGESSLEYVEDSLRVLHSLLIVAASRGITISELPYMDVIHDNLTELVENNDNNANIAQRILKIVESD